MAEDQDTVGSQWSLHWDHLAINSKTLKSWEKQHIYGRDNLEGRIQDSFCKSKGTRISSILRAQEQMNHGIVKVGKDL